jgi:cob(I)alamin adenosyltransferase
MTLAEDVTALQERLRDAERQRVRAEGARDSAQAAFATARDELKAEFGVSTVEEAAALLTQLKEELAGIVADISTKLDEIGV